MALGDIGMFLPPEEAYTRPGSYESALQAESTKRASYLSSMDQFYAGLEAAMERLETEITSREKMFGEELAWKKEYGAEQLAIERSKISQTYRLGEGQTRLGERQLGLQEEHMDWLREQYESRSQPGVPTTYGGYTSTPSAPSASYEDIYSNYPSTPSYSPESGELPWGSIQEGYESF